MNLRSTALRALTNHHFSSLRLKIVASILLISCLSFGQKKKQIGHLAPNENYKVKPFVSLQFWSSYTMQHQIYEERLEAYIPVKNRFNTQLRRSRLGVKGQPFKQIKYNITGALDLVGHDLLSATLGGGNNGSSPSFRIWNAYIQWKIREKSDLFHLTVGYLVPQIGRESINSALKVSSIEKAISQHYLRRHLTGIGPGRSMGLNLGGYLMKDNEFVAISYDGGLFNPLYESLNGNSLGHEPSLLKVGRIVFHLGDPEHQEYSLGHKTNYGGKRYGASIGFAGAQQGKTEIFDSNLTYGIDWLVNWGNFNVDGEWVQLIKTGHNELQGFETKSFTGYFRFSYTIALDDQYVIEPAFMYSFFKGPLDITMQEFASSVKEFSGDDLYYDVGVNFHFNSSIKLFLHYVFNNGNAGESENRSPAFNNYYYQSGVGSIKRGNWLGLGLVTLF